MEAVMIKRAVIFILIFSISIFPAILPAYAQQEESPDLMSLDLKGMDIRDVLKIFAQKSGLNIVADKDVKGTISLYVKDVMVIDALDILVTTNDLAYEEEGTLIRVMTDKKYEKLHGQAFRENTKTEIVKLNYASPSSVAQALGNMKTKVGKIISDDASGTIVLIDNAENIKRMKNAATEMDMLLVTEVFSLDYAKAEIIKDKLEKMLSQNIGSIKFDDRTNKIIVKDTPKKIEEIKKVLEAFDEKTREVMIDANIVQVTLSDKHSYGIDWAAVASLPDGKFEIATNLTTKLAGTTPAMLTIGTSVDHRAVMSFLNTFGKTNVLSRPRITVANREEAKIMVGAKEVYVTSEVTTTSGGTYNSADHVQFVDVGVTLGVTPEINKEGYVKMKIKPAVSNTDSTKTVTLTNPDGSTRTIIPYVTTSEAETTVLVKDNTTLILGGLMKDTITEYNDKVPFLGDIPGLGKLFSTKGKGREKTELVIFLTPHIIEGDKTFEEVTKYMDEFKEEPVKKKTEETKAEDAKIAKPVPEKAAIETVKEKEPEKIEKAKIEDAKTDKVVSGKAAVKTVKTAKVPQKIYAKPKAKAAAEKKIIKVKEPEKKEKSKSKWAPLFGGQDKSADKAKAVPEKSVKAVKAQKVRPSQENAVKKTPYEEYYLALRQEINNLAEQDKDIAGIKGDVELQFTLDKEGFLIKGPLVLNNPDLRLVRSIVKAVKKAAPFRKFPNALKKDQADFNIIVRCE
jgi:MSHA type pilus biogenesis protein MshL